MVEDGGNSSTLSLRVWFEKYTGVGYMVCSVVFVASHRKWASGRLGIVFAMNSTTPEVVSW